MMNDKKHKPSPTDAVREFYLRIVRDLASKPDHAIVQAQGMNGAFALECRPHPVDMGAFIGSGGSIDAALRTLVTVVARRAGFKSIHYAVDGPDAGYGGTKRPEAADVADWPRCDVEDLFGFVTNCLFDRAFEWGWKHAPHKSTIMLSISRSEARHVPDPMLEEAISRVVGAVARIKGRKVFVSMERGLE